MPVINVECQNEECTKYNDYECEWESCAEGSTHVCECDCGTKAQFTISYPDPIADEEQAI